MKILNLLEGSEVLYHVTTETGMKGILRKNGILLGALSFSMREHDAFAKAYPNFSGKLYYLSMSRNRANAFALSAMESAITNNEMLFRICFSGRTVSKYGKIVPFNFFNVVHERGEMEDRLVTDKYDSIPLSAVDHVDIFVPRMSMHALKTDPEVQGMLSLLGRVAHCRFYDTRQSFIAGRGDIKFDVSDDGDIDDDFHSYEGNVPFQARILTSYLKNVREGKPFTSDVSEVVKYGGVAKLLRNTRIGSDGGYDLRRELKLSGYKSVYDIDKLDRELEEKFG